MSVSAHAPAHRTQTREVVSGAHGGLDCGDAEAILAESTAEAAALRAELDSLRDQRDQALREADTVRLEASRLRALFDDVSRKNTSLINERDDLAAQVKYVNEELAALEQDAVPEGTMVYGTVSREQMVAMYRQVSRIARGPLPPAVVDAVHDGHADIVASMETAGREALSVIIRREVRRRRRQARR